MDNTRKKYMVPDVKSIAIDFEISLTIESNPDGFDNENTEGAYNYYSEQNVFKDKMG